MLLNAEVNDEEYPHDQQRYSQQPSPEAGAARECAIREECIVESGSQAHLGSFSARFF